MSNDLRPDADVVAMANGIVARIEEIDALAVCRGWTLGPTGKMIRMAAECFRDIIAAFARERPSRHVARERRGDWTVTASGGRIYTLDPRPEEVSLADISHALALKVRWSGIMLRLYTVAEHSIRVGRLAAYLAEESGASPGVRALACVYGLLHDANEAYLPDVPRPIKAHLDGWPEVESRMQEVIHEALGLAPPTPEVALYVTRADDLLLDIESRDPSLFGERARATILDHHRTPGQVTSEMERAAESPVEFLDHPAVTFGALLQEVEAAIASIPAGVVPVVPVDAPSSGRRQYLAEAAPGVPASDFDPPPHLRSLLGG